MATTFRRDQIPESVTLEEAVDLGFDFDQPMQSAFADTWDPDGGDEVDYGWIGEDARGVWLKVHPIAALSRFPELASVANEVRARGLESMPSDAFERMSAWQWLAYSACVQAVQRLRSRKP